MARQKTRWDTPRPRSIADTARAGNGTQIFPIWRTPSDHLHTPTGEQIE